MDTPEKGFQRLEDYVENNGSITQGEEIYKKESNIEEDTSLD
jgi:hypothetical protein